MAKSTIDFEGSVAYHHGTITAETETYAWFRHLDGDRTNVNCQIKIRRALLSKSKKCPRPIHQRATAGFIICFLNLNIYNPNDFIWSYSTNTISQLANPHHFNCFNEKQALLLKHSFLVAENGNRNTS
ncbi:hypothetical protein RUND412_010091 [Rhizina undulata]